MIERDEILPHTHNLGDGRNNFVAIIPVFVWQLCVHIGELLGFAPRLTTKTGQSSLKTEDRLPSAESCELCPRCLCNLLSTHPLLSFNISRPSLTYSSRFKLKALPSRIPSYPTTISSNRRENRMVVRSKPKGSARL